MSGPGKSSPVHSGTTLSTASRLRIDTDYLQRQLKRFLAIPSPTGFTDSLVHEVADELERLGLAVELTRRGAIRAVRPGIEPLGARAIVTHLDTLGAMVTRLQDNGRLALRPIGHWSARFAEGARATLFSEAGTYRGTILPLRASGHTFNDEVDTQPVGWDYVELRVDAPARNRAGLFKLGIDVGDILAIDPQPEFLDNGYIVSRHLDNKAGVATALAALSALQREDTQTPVSTHWLFTVAEEVGVGASSIVTDDIASLLAIDNGTTAPGQNSDETGVTIAMADQSGPFDYHLTRKLVAMCRDNDIRFQKDVFRYYRSDSASALEAGADVRTALATFGVDASHGYERIHLHALRSLAELITAFARSPVDILRDRKPLADATGFTEQLVSVAVQGYRVPEAKRLPD